MELTVHSLNRYNCKELEATFESSTAKRERVIINFTYLYNIDHLGYQTFIKLRNIAWEKGIELYITGQDNFQLKNYLSTVQYRDWY